MGLSETLDGLRKLSFSTEDVKYVSAPRAAYVPPPVVPGVPSRRDKDLALWERWKQTGSDVDLGLLIQQVNPIIQKEVNKWAGSLARPVLEAEGKRLAVMAFSRYDPSRGAAIGSHVTDWLKKMSRLSYAHQNVARLPENKMLQFHTYNLGLAQLTDTLGRPPATDELADNLGWSIKHLEQFQKDIAHQELMETGGGGKDDDGGGGTAGLPFQHEESDQIIHFIHHDLPPVQKQIFEHLTGFGGAKEKNNQELMKHLGLTQGQFSYQKRLLINRIEDVMKGKA